MSPQPAVPLRTAPCSSGVARARPTVLRQLCLPLRGAWALTSVSEGSCSTSSNENLDTVVSELVDTMAMQLSSLEANQAERIATYDPAVFTPQIRRRLAAEMDSDCVHLHDGVRDHPKSSQAKPLVLFGMCPTSSRHHGSNSTPRALWPGDASASRYNHGARRWGCTSRHGYQELLHCGTQ